MRSANLPNDTANASSAPPSDPGRSSKGLARGQIGIFGATVIGVSCIAPAYTLTSGLGPTISTVGT